MALKCRWTSHRRQNPPISRARERLFINTPSKLEGDLSKLEGIFKILRVWNYDKMYKIVLFLIFHILSMSIMGSCKNENEFIIVRYDRCILKTMF